MSSDMDVLEEMIDAGPMPGICSATLIDDGSVDLDSPSIVIGIDLQRCDEPLSAKPDLRQSLMHETV